MAEPAPQDFRDGVRHGVELLAHRIREVRAYGIPLADEQIAAMAHRIGVDEYGGIAPEPSSSEGGDRG